MSGVSFVQYDSFVDGIDSDKNNRRIVIFGTSRFMEFVGRSKRLTMDGTFLVTPTLFHQTYIIHGMYQGFHLPLLYILMTGKDNGSYIEVFRAIRERCLELGEMMTVETVQVDFELATTQAVKEVFPRVSIEFCYFCYIV